MTPESKALEKAVSAEEISKEFKEHSVAEFFKKNMQMLGLTGKIKTLTTMVCKNSSLLTLLFSAKTFFNLELMVLGCMH